MRYALTFVALCASLSGAVVLHAPGRSPVGMNGRSPSSGSSSLGRRGSTGTNANRLARGLPPAPPRQLFKPSATRGRRQADPSAVPQPRIQSVIRVYATENGQPIGYIQNVAGASGSVPHYDDGRNTALVVSFAVRAAGSTTSLKLENVVGTSLPFLGYVEGPASSSPDLVQGSHNYGLMTWMEETPINSPPQSVAHSYAPAPYKKAESAVWTFEPFGGVGIQWVNTDGSKPPTDLTCRAGFVVITGDSAAYRDHYGDDWEPCYLRFEVVL